MVSYLVQKRTETVSRLAGVDHTWHLSARRPKLWSPSAGIRVMKPQSLGFILKPQLVRAFCLLSLVSQDSGNCSNGKDQTPSPQFLHNCSSIQQKRSDIWLSKCSWTEARNPSQIQWKLLACAIDFYSLFGHQVWEMGSRACLFLCDKAVPGQVPSFSGVEQVKVIFLRWEFEIPSWFQ